MAKKKILWLTDSVWQPTGYGIVGRNVLKHLAKNPEFEVHAVCLEHIGGKIKVDEGYTCHPRLMDDHGFDILGGYIKELNPDIVVTLRDVGLQAGYAQSIIKCKQEGWKGKWYAYLPIDTGRTAHDWPAILKPMDKIIAMSLWGKKIIKEQMGFDSVYIPHGVDTDVFKPMTAEEKEKEKKGKPYSDSFIVGAVGRNQYRKMWNCAVKGFAGFAKDKNDVCFLYHSDVNPAAHSDGWIFEYIGIKYGCQNKMLPTFKNLNAGTRFWIDDPMMNRIYNHFDVFMLLTGGEGFGIPILEAQAAGIPVITTDYTTGRELVGDHGILIPPLKDSKGRNVIWEGQNGVEFVVPDWDAATEALEKLYNDKELREKYAKESREYALNYSWDKVVLMWEKLLLDENN
jgi:glycosyltransferase involved in cell wall biosynthesis